MRSAGKMIAVASAVAVGAGVMASAASRATGQKNEQPPPAASVQSAAPTVAFPHDGERMTPAAQTSMLDTICVQCHTDRRKPGGVSFEHVSIDDVVRNGELAERMLAKLRAGMMPPVNAPKRPDQAAVQAFV